MNPKSYIALVLITIAVACSANAHNELAQYIINNNTAKFRTTIKKLAKREQLNLASPCDEYNNTLLHLAVQRGSLSFVKALMRYIDTDLGNYVYLQNCAGWNSLQVAVHTWELDLLKYLITKKGGIDNERDRELLDTAAIVGDLECVTYLVEECGLDVGQIDDEGGTPLHYAASEGNLSCMLYLIDKIKAKGMPELLKHQGGRFNNSPLHCLMASKEREDDPEKFCQVVEALKGNKPLRNSNQKTPLDLALNKPSIEISILSDHDTVTNGGTSEDNKCAKALE
ncbi:MAG: ankyrin repeat domain-containing protein [Bacteroidota bacterium]